MRTPLILALLSAAPIAAFAQKVDEPKIDVSSVEKISAKSIFQIADAKATFSDRIHLSNDGNFVTVQTKGNKTLVYDLTGKEPKIVFEGKGERAMLSPSGKKILVRNFIGHNLYDVKTGKESDKVSDGTSSKSAFLTEDSILLLKEGSGDKFTAVVWDLAKKKEAGTFAVEGKVDSRFSMFVDSTGKTVSFILDGSGFLVDQYDIATKKRIKQAKAVAPMGISEYTHSALYGEVSSDGKTFGGLAPGGYVIHDASNGNPLAKIIGLAAFPSGVLKGETTLKNISGDLAKKAGLQEKDYVIYNWKTNKVIAGLTGHKGTPVDSIAAQSTNGKTLVILNQSGECCVFDISKVK